jgi:hypothetical protein
MVLLIKNFFIQTGMDYFGAVKLIPGRYGTFQKQKNIFFLNSISFLLLIFVFTICFTICDFMFWKQLLQ